MEHTLLTVLSCIALLLALAFIIKWCLNEIKKEHDKNEADYDKKYNQVKKMIDKNKVRDLSYDWIMMLLTNLGKMKHKNREKTSVLTTNFFWKYRAIAAIRASKEN